MIENLTHKEILLKKAKEDFETAKRLTEFEGFSEEIVLFHCQQAIEKYLKAYLDAKNIVYPKTHDLEALLSMCIEKDDSFNTISFVTFLTPYALDIRYDEFTPQSGESIAQILQQVEKALNFIISKI